ncbi:MAG: TolC family protein [Acidobacteria bacterium]|nr:TolC family protein [Acidobacteriota bacterium]
MLRSHPSLALTAGTRLEISRRALAVALLCLTSAATANAETIRLDANAAAERVVAVSHGALASAARVEAARAFVAAADASRLPAVAATATVARRSSVPEFAVPLAGAQAPPVVIAPDITTTYATGVRATQVLYSGGAISAGRQASRDDLAATDAARSQALADLRLTARLAYWDAVRADAGREAATAQQQRAERLLTDTRALLDAGMAVRADLLAAESRHASARVQVSRAETRAVEATARLRSLLLLGDGDTLELADRLGTSLPAPPGDLAKLQRDALATRPELAALAAQRAALAARETAVLAQARPSLALAAQWDLARPNQRYFPLADEWNDSWSVGLAAGWTLFDGGRARADAAASRAGQRALAEEREDAARRVALDVELARRDVESALDEVGAADAAHAAATERERASLERQQAGLATMVEMLDAQADLAAAELQQIDVRATAWIAAARLQRAVGR